jgi:thiol-disulfide isomerase/thioredoxin
MNTREEKKSVYKIFAMVRPWLFYIGLFVVLRYTGAISAVSAVAQQTLMKTGVMDAEPAQPTIEKKFDYNFSLRDINENKINVESLKGKTLFINVWATWCGPCRVEMPSIQSLYDQVDHNKIAFIMLSLDQNDPYRKVRTYIQDQGFTFPVYFPASNLPSQLQVESIPATFVIDKEGKVVFREIGAANYGTEEFKNFLMGL